MTYPPQQPNYQSYPEASQSTVVLVLGIMGLIVCQVLAPVAWYMGSQEVTAIDTGRRDPSGRSTANAGRILGIIGTVFLIIGVVAFVFFLIAALALADWTEGVVTGISDNALVVVGAL
jgi:hypothetical protein